jgi:undecaprenyl-diphosphatase
VISRILRAGDSVNDVDRAISKAVSALPPSSLDRTMKDLSTAANHSLLWFTIASVLAARRGATRKAAARGVLSIGVASFLANAVLKPLLPRRRPAASELPAYQTIANPPTSSSFPSGHSASAAAFATAVSMESPLLGLVVTPLAAAVAYSRVHVGVHWASDVVVGAAVGSGVAALTQRWWPVRDTDEARARPMDTVPELPGGEGLVLISNQRSGSPEYDPATELAAALPQAVVLSAEPERDLDEQLDTALRERNGWVRAIGVAGGDGTVAAAAAVAGRWKLPLVVVPTGTLNHFARDVGLESAQDAADAVVAGSAVRVDVADVNGTPFLNTASIGAYPDMVRRRDELTDRMGKWIAMTVAAAQVLRSQAPVRLVVNGRPLTVWIVFIGNCLYTPRGLSPAWRPRLEDGLLDVQYLRADLRFGRTRAVLATLFGVSEHARSYGHVTAEEVRVECRSGPEVVAYDGEMGEEATEFVFRKRAVLTVYCCRTS